MTRNRKIDILLGLILIIFALFYGIYYKLKLRDYGVITIARIDKFESSEQGGNLYVTIFLKKNKYQTIVNSLCMTCVKSFYFIKVLPDDPTNHPIFLEDKPVPKCILENEHSFEGWKDIPKDTCHLDKK